MSEKLIRLKSVLEITGKSRSSIYADIAAGSFPRPVSIGARSVAWRLSLVDEWVMNRIGNRSLKSQKDPIYTRFLNDI